MRDMCSDAQELLYKKIFSPYTERRHENKSGVVKSYTYNSRTNVYSLSVIIYFIVYNLGWYREESNLIRSTSWRFLNRYAPVDYNNPTGEELRYLVPTPLELDFNSGLLKLIMNINDLGIVATLEDEEKKSISLKSRSPYSTPYFNFIVLAWCVIKINKCL